MDKHINDICAKANRKLSVLSRMCSVLSQSRKNFQVLSNPNLNTVLLFGCFVAEKAIVR